MACGLRRKSIVRKEKLKQALFLRKISDCIELKEDGNILQPNRQLATSIHEAWQVKRESLEEFHHQNRLKPILSDVLPRGMSGEQWSQINGLISNIHKDFSLRRRMLIKRLEVTVDSFQRSKGLNEEAKELLKAELQQRMTAIEVEPKEYTLSELFSAPRSLLMELTAKATASSSPMALLSSSVGGGPCMVKALMPGTVPDRGGRTNALRQKSAMPFKKSGGGGGGGKNRNHFQNTNNNAKNNAINNTNNNASNNANNNAKNNQKNNINSISSSNNHDKSESNSNTSSVEVLPGKVSGSVPKDPKKEEKSQNKRKNEKNGDEEISLKKAKE
eukprot:CAMPEP_0170063942 /NCGR_PEP_ID=MMETSP0019_2-20121128/4621_1 /TAXON_ID=98059 /ORGANISM="Dinobryon sp., Strain UTEXLB2267" /LENGTH=330 /DNA_ID=CAMNT_0010270499 /DNA_START=284 /DNA_END=1276 /DNA_ORIENTATION=-